MDYAPTRKLSTRERKPVYNCVLGAVGQYSGLVLVIRVLAGMSP